VSRVVAIVVIFVVLANGFCIFGVLAFQWLLLSVFIFPLPCPMQHEYWRSLIFPKCQLWMMAMGIAATPVRRLLALRIFINFH